MIQSLALAYREFNLKYDELTVDEVAREVEMHRPDGVPDTVQQVKHGALLILAQFHNIGHAIRGTHEPDLRQYTQVGDGASKTDGRIYDPKLGPNETKGDYSGKPDDRWIFTTNNPYFQWNAIAALAAAADTLKGWDDRISERLPRYRDQNMEGHDGKSNTVSDIQRARPRDSRKRCAGGLSGCCLWRTGHS